MNRRRRDSLVPQSQAGVLLAAEKCKKKKKKKQFTFLHFLQCVLCKMFFFCFVACLFSLVFGDELLRMNAQSKWHRIC